MSERVSGRDRPCNTPGCNGIGYHPNSHPKPLRWCLDCLVRRKRERRHGAKTEAEKRNELAAEGPGYQPPPLGQSIQSSCEMGFGTPGCRRIDSGK